MFVSYLNVRGEYIEDSRKSNSIIFYQFGHNNLQIYFLLLQAFSGRKWKQRG